MALAWPVVLRRRTTHRSGSHAAGIDALREALVGFQGELTVADAAARAALSTQEAEDALRHLAAEYGGHIAATTKGELIYAFPKGLQRLADTPLKRAARAARVVLLAAGAFSSPCVAFDCAHWLHRRISHVDRHLVCEADE